MRVFFIFLISSSFCAHAGYFGYRVSSEWNGAGLLINVPGSENDEMKEAASLFQNFMTGLSSILSITEPQDKEYLVMIGDFASSRECLLLWHQIFTNIGTKSGRHFLISLRYKDADDNTLDYRAPVIANNDLHETTFSFTKSDHTKCTSSMNTINFNSSKKEELERKFQEAFTENSKDPNSELAERKLCALARAL